MVDSVMGTRIAERRRQLGVTQAEMARRIGISPSYLNLIERNKRRIAGSLLRRTAESLGVTTEELDGAQERRLADALREVSTLPAPRQSEAEVDQIPELIARFPGWAHSVAALARSERLAENTARALSDRMAHDPFLGEAVHGMLSRVAAIRSAAEILTEFRDLPDEDRRSFSLIIRTEAEALTETGEALASYFDREERTERRLTPVDETEALYDARDNHFVELETPHVATDTIESILAGAPQIETDAARTRARRRLTAYAEDAGKMPLNAFIEAAQKNACDLEFLADHFGTEVETVFRRMATTPATSNLPQCGYFLANASGSIIEMMGVEGLSVPRYSATCPLWILFRAQRLPDQIWTQYCEMPNGARFVFVARARRAGPERFGQAQHFLTDMLVMPAAAARSTVYGRSIQPTPEPVGPSCRICPRVDCRHRVADPLAG